MTLNAWGFIWLSLYIAGLAALAVYARRFPKGQRNILGGMADFFKSTDKRLGIPVLIFTFSATLFSAFFMVGLPGFIYTHGLATWAWVIFGDVVGMLGLYFVAMRFVRLSRGRDNIWSPLQIICPNAASRFLFVALTTVFILPYLAVQISGFGRLLETATDGGVPMIIASAAGLAIIYLYSLVAGIRGIAFSDFLQGILLLGCVVGLGIVVTSDSGGPFELLRTVQDQRPDLFKRPGPTGLMTFGFLLTGFAIFVALPITQPQFLTRYLLVNEADEVEAARYFRAVALGMGFLIAVGGLFIVPIALTGALQFPGLASGDEVLGTLLREKTFAWFGGLFTVGVLAAAMSTADSILFSLGQIFSVDVYKNLIAKDASESQMKFVSRSFILLVALAALIMGIANSDLIVTLARVSFEGMLLLLPTVLFGLWGRNRWEHAASASILLGAVLFWFLREPVPALVPGLSAAVPSAIVGVLPFLFRQRGSRSSSRRVTAL